MVFDFKKVYRNREGQSIIEFTIFIVMVALVFLSLFSRSTLSGFLQGRWRKDVSGSIGTEQYSNARSTAVYTNTFQSSIQGVQGFNNDFTNAYAAHFISI